MTRRSVKVVRTVLLTLSAAALLACGSSGSDQAATGGSPAGGNKGTGGTTPTGGSTASTDGKLCSTPQALISDFSQAQFGSATTLAGGEYVYPTTGTYGLTSDFSGGNWHISGTVGDYSGFGLYLDGCSHIDASAFKGISFKVSGTVEQGGGITLEISTLNDTITATWLNSHGGNVPATDPGRCLPPTTDVNQWAQSTCAEPQQVIPVTTTPTVQTILWSDFSGGKPEATVKASDITSIHWFFPNPDGIGSGTPTPYKVDITIDDLSFIAQ